MAHIPIGERSTYDHMDELYENDTLSDSLDPEAIELQKLEDEELFDSWALNMERAWDDDNDDGNGRPPGFAGLFLVPEYFPE